MSNDTFQLKPDGEFMSHFEMSQQQEVMIEASKDSQPTFMYGRYDDLDNKVMFKLGE